MGRTSDKHGPRTDEALEEEAEVMDKGVGVSDPARQERERGREGTEPDPGERVPIAGGETPDRSLPDEELERRHQLGRFLQRNFPATRDEILEGARDLQAPPEVIAQLERLPNGSYDGFPQVWEALGGQVEGDRKH